MHLQMNGDGWDTGYVDVMQVEQRLSKCDILESHWWNQNIWISRNNQFDWIIKSCIDRKFQSSWVNNTHRDRSGKICHWCRIRLASCSERLHDGLAPKREDIPGKSFQGEHTRIVTRPLVDELRLIFAGKRTEAFSVKGISLLDRDLIDAASTARNTDEVLMIIVWPIFKWTSAAEVNNAIVWMYWLAIWFAACFW